MTSNPKEKVREINTSDPAPAVIPSDVPQFTESKRLSLRDLQVQALIATQEIHNAQERAQKAGAAFQQALQAAINELDIKRMDVGLDLNTLTFSARAPQGK
jgi:hypothetical protein